jgi:hypothetical protein
MEAGMKEKQYIEQISRHSGAFRVMRRVSIKESAKDGGDVQFIENFSVETSDGRNYAPGGISLRDAEELAVELNAKVSQSCWRWPSRTYIAQISKTTGRYKPMRQLTIQAQDDGAETVNERIWVAGPCGEVFYGFSAEEAVDYAESRNEADRLNYDGPEILETRDLVAEPLPPKRDRRPFR